MVMAYKVLHVYYPNDLTSLMSGHPSLLYTTWLNYTEVPMLLWTHHGISHFYPFVCILLFSSSIIISVSSFYIHCDTQHKKRF